MSYHSGSFSAAKLCPKFKDCALSEKSPYRGRSCGSHQIRINFNFSGEGEGNFFRLLPQNHSRPGCPAGPRFSVPGGDVAVDF